MTFSGKVAFITGGGSGMGQLASRNLAAKGVLVAALDVNTSGLEETAAGFDNILTLSADVTEPADIEEAAKRVEQDLGPIGRVYNAAAVFPTKRVLDQDTATMRRHHRASSRSRCHRVVTRQGQTLGLSRPWHEDGLAHASPVSRLDVETDPQHRGLLA